MKFASIQVNASLNVGMVSIFYALLVTHVSQDIVCFLSFVLKFISSGNEARHDNINFIRLMHCLRHGSLRHFKGKVNWGIFLVLNQSDGQDRQFHYPSFKKLVKCVKTFPNFS